MRLRRHLVALVAAAAAIAAALAVSQPTPAAAATGGSITVILDTEPSDGTDVRFTGCQGTDCGPFTLDDDSDGTFPDRITASDLAPATYTITQDAVPGWTVTSLSCSPSAGVTHDVANRVTTIVLTAGANVTCTYRNRSPSITITHDATPSHGQDITYTGCLGSGCATFALDDDGDPGLPDRISASGLAVGTYTITQSPTAAWPLSSISCNTLNGITTDVPNRRITIALTSPTDWRACTFRNVTQTITIVDDELTDSGQDHGYTGCGISGCSQFTLDDDAGTDPSHLHQMASGPLPPGTYTIDQDELPDGSELSDLVCPGEAVELLAGRATITLTPGEHRTCTFTTRPTPAPLTDVAEISRGGAWHTCARLTTGQVRCWGTNPGNGVEGAALAPVVVQNPAGTGPLTGVVDIASGYTHTCAVLEDTTVVCWGTNIEGELGNGELDKDEPALLPVVVQNESGTGSLTGVESLAIGWYHVCAVLVDGEARCWGGNDTGQLGTGAASTRSLLPVAVMGEDGVTPLQGVRRVAAGLGYTCALLDAGNARCWGRGELLGDGRSTDSSAPVTVMGAEGSGPLDGITDLSGRWGHTCATLDTGSAMCWGWLPTATSTVDALLPRAIGDELGNPRSDVTSVATGEYHTCYSTQSGGVFCWGGARNGVLGNGSTTAGSSQPTPALERSTGEPLADVVSVTASHHGSCAVLTTGQARCWGLLSGDGTDIHRPWAVPVADP